MKKFVLTRTTVMYNKLTPPWMGSVTSELFTSLRKAEKYMEYVIDQHKKRGDKIIEKIDILSNDENEKVLYIVSNDEGIQNIYFEISKQYTID